MHNIPIFFQIIPECIWYNTGILSKCYTLTLNSVTTSVCVHNNTHYTNNTTYGKPLPHILTNYPLCHNIMSLLTVSKEVTSHKVICYGVKSYRVSFFPSHNGYSGLSEAVHIVHKKMLVFPTTAHDMRMLPSLQ